MGRWHIFKALVHRAFQKKGAAKFKQLREAGLGHISWIIISHLEDYAMDFVSISSRFAASGLRLRKRGILCSHKTRVRVSVSASTTLCITLLHVALKLNS